MEGLGFGVRSTDAGFLELARTYLRGFLAGSTSGGRPQEQLDDEELTFSADCGVERVMPGGKRIEGINTLYRGTLAVYRGRDRRQMLARLVSSARDIATSHSNQFVRFRAGAVELDGGAVVLPSVPEPHLPALVGALVGRGARYLGDELVNVDPILRRVHGVRMPLLLDLEDLSLFAGVAPDPASRRRRRGAPPDPAFRALTPRWPVSVEELGGEHAGSTPLRWIVFPRFEPGALTEIGPAGGAEDLFRFTQSCLNLNVWGERALILMRELLGSSPASRLVVGSIPDAAELLLRSVPDARGGEPR